VKSEKGKHKREREEGASDGAPREKLGRREYEKELERLHVELVKLQEWVKYKGLEICVVFEGRDGAGKGGTIKAITEAGEIVIFDRSWYSRAGVERVMGFCTEEQVKKFLVQVPLVEKAFVESGIILLKYWLEVSEAEQTRRLESRIDDGRKVWKLSPMDLDSYSRWYDYSRARDEMFSATDTGYAPWFVST
jgi:polyphosphate kinase 2 (PPK2 family)